jgi:glycerol-3-phosphate acyltransferase PlsY
MIAGFFALIGHCYPVWLKFKGGKGVATTLGTLIALYWPVGLSACGIWLLSAVIFRISSLSALIAVGLTPVIAHFMTGNANLSGLCAMIAALVYIKHRDNIKRIFAGTEPKIGKKK